MIFRRKVLLMGRSGSGKTSMRSIIFSNYAAKDAKRLGATIDVEHSHVKFLGNMLLNLWDCGGQESFMDNYLAAQRSSVFKTVEVLIYVFDVESAEFERDLAVYTSCLDAIRDLSPDAKVFILIHKMDLVQEGMRQSIFDERCKILRQRSDPIKIQCIATSIWDETLYKAWSKIIHALIPNVAMLEKHLESFIDMAEGAEEVVLFEKTTFLLIASAIRQDSMQDSSRYEKTSAIIKQFKQSCTKLQSHVNSLELRAHNFTAYLSVLTAKTYIMVIFDDVSIESAAIHLNIDSVKRNFEQVGGGIWA